MILAKRSAEAIDVGGSDTAAPLNLRKRVDLIARSVDLPNARLLDAGCGAGEYVLALAERGADAQGVEYVAEKVKQWQLAHPSDNRVRRGDLAQLEHEDQSFDVVLLNEVLEHVPDDMGALQELYRVLRAGGTIILFSPNRFHPFETHGVYTRRTGKHVGNAKTFLLPYVPIALGKHWVTYWSRNYWPAELAAMVRRAGFDVVSRGYVWQTFENISGEQPRWVASVRPIARMVVRLAERLPGIRKLGVSQLIVARRPEY